jgi:AraC-like DNA-binding protein
MKALEGIELEEQFAELARDVVTLHRDGVAQMSRLSAVRGSTREELYRRVCRGREYLHGRASEPVTLKEIARAACLSEFHFHRMFRAAFGVTASEYLRNLRMQRARVLLRDLPVTEVAAEVGYESLPTFSRVFRSYYGVAPSGIRKIG